MNPARSTERSLARNVRRMCSDVRAFKLSLHERLAPSLVKRSEILIRISMAVTSSRNVAFAEVRNMRSTHDIRCAGTCDLRKINVRLADRALVVLISNEIRLDDDFLHVGK